MSREKDMDEDTNDQQRKKTQQEYLFGKDYENFDPRAHLKLHYLIGGQTEKVTETIEPLLVWYHETFASDKFRGSRLLDVCSGPSIHNAISASKYYTDIYLLEYARVNRDFLGKWIAREADAADWSEMFHFAANKEGGGITPEGVETRIRKAIRGVVPCDLTEEEPFEGDEMPTGQVDAIISSMTLESAAPDRKSYQCMLKKLTARLATGGLLLLVGVINQTYYLAYENKIFSSLSLDLEFVRTTIRELGLEEIGLKVVELKTEPEASDRDGAFLMKAVKL